MPTTVRGRNAGGQEGRAHALQDVGGHQLVELRVQVLLRIHLPHSRDRPVQRLTLNAMSSSEKALTSCQGRAVQLGITSGTQSRHEADLNENESKRAREVSHKTRLATK